MGARAALAIAWLLTIGACDLVFGIPFRGDPDGSLGDVGPDVMSSPCVMSQEAFADFETTQAAVCQGIGAPNIAGDPPPHMYIEDGQLRIQPPPGTATGNGCTVNEMLFGDGVFVEVARLFDHRQASVFFRFFSIDPPGSLEAGFTASAGTIAMFGSRSSGGSQETLGTVAFDASSHWWRLRADRLGDRVVGEVSGDGRSWAMVGEIPGTVPASIKLVVGAVITDTTAISPNAAAFEHVNVCP